jgi:hypothetical protein
VAGWRSMQARNRAWAWHFFLCARERVRACVLGVWGGGKQACVREKGTEWPVLWYGTTSRFKKIRHADDHREVCHIEEWNLDRIYKRIHIFFFCRGLFYTTTPRHGCHWVCGLWSTSHKSIASCFMNAVPPPTIAAVVGCIRAYASY